MHDNMVELKMERGTFAACSLYRLIDTFKYFHLNGQPWWDWKSEVSGLGLNILVT